MKLAKQLRMLCESSINESSVDVVYLDSDPDLVELFSDYVGGETKYRLVSTINPNEADDYVGKSRVLITDPHNKKNLDVARKFKSRGAKVIIYDGSNGDDDYSNEFDLVIPKPSDLDDMIKKIEGLI